MFVHWQLRKAAGLAEVDVPVLHLTSDLIKTCYSNYCREWSRNQDNGIDRFYAAGLEGEDLVVIWASPPCTTFSKLDRTNRSKHRNWKKNGAPRSPLAFFDDALVANLFAGLRGED